LDDLDELEDDWRFCWGLSSELDCVYVLFHSPEYDTGSFCTAISVENRQLYAQWWSFVVTDHICV
jgi:hypothetical protein